nr:hypothetical protein [Tanacetum cinerariifolium]
MSVSHGDKTSRATRLEKVEGLCGIDVKEKMKKVVAPRKKISNKEMDVAARATANEAQQGMQGLQLLRRMRRTATLGREVHCSGGLSDRTMCQRFVVSDSSFSY